MPQAGLGFAFMTFLNGTLESGIKIVLEETRLSDYIKDADIVVTGEGRLDGQTVMGKAPIGVAKIAKQFDKPVLGVLRLCHKRCHCLQPRGH